MLELFEFRIHDVPEAERMLRKRDRSATCRERIDDEIRTLLLVNVDRAFEAAASNHAGRGDHAAAPFLEVAPDGRARLPHTEVLRVVGLELLRGEATATP